MNKALLLIILITSIASAQRGIISGTLKESNGPLPGANVIVKGTTTSTQTDFDGNYSIECNVGDVLLITFVGFATQEITVTQEMLEGAIIPYKAPRIAVQQIKTTAYSKALSQRIDSLHSIPDINASPYLYTDKNDYHSFKNIKSIKIENHNIYIDHTKSQLYLKTQYTAISRLRFIKDNNLPNGVINPFSTTTQFSQNATTSLHNNKLQSGITLSHDFGKDNYNNNTHNNYGLSGKFKSTLDPNKLQFNASINYNKATNRFANINGYQNLIFKEQLLSFTENTNLLNTINNSTSKQNSQLFGGHLNLSKKLGDNFNVLTDQTITFSKIEEEYFLEDGVFDYENGYNSYKEIDHIAFNNKAIFKSYIDLYPFNLNTTSTLSSQYEKTNYSFNEVINLNTTDRKVNLNQHIFEIKNNIELSYNRFLYLTTSISQLYSTNQKGDSFIPQASLTFTPTSALYYLQSDFLSYFNIAFRYGQSAGTTSLLYSNYSHNSLILDSLNAEGLLNNVDLFFPEDLDLEKTTSFEIAIDSRYFNNRLSIGASYENRKDNNGIFPIKTGDNFTLSNIANTQTRGFDINVKTINLRNNSNNNYTEWTTDITLSRKRTKTNSLLSSNTRIPIAGFSTINANLIAGETAGVLIGSAFARDTQGAIIRDAIGNPTQATELQIIGDPTPDFNLGLSNHLSIGRWKIELTLDYQKGGDIWNGTQQAIDGFIDADESYIEDASYLNLKSITTSFELIDRKKWNNSQHNPFFNSFKISGFANNLATTTSYKGATPYSSIFDSTNTQGFQFFNTPLATEVGINIAAKF